jgi:hypothetical protein
MHSISDSRLNVESGEGKVRALADTAVSICSIEDRFRLARAFNLAKASCEALQRACQYLT